MKAYTDLEQSKKLAKILPIESADMRYAPFGDTHPWVWDEEVKLLENGAVPCWSLAALMEILSSELQDNHYLTLDKEPYENGDEYCCCYEDCNGNSFRHCFSDNPVDACYEMIIKLKEKGLI